ncbi:MAG: family 14 glycosylhydrolase [FCB group bacterium]|jgi:hypothetical protein|nr:family 14 glycosylhydrolase [FCB group bacterium]
MRFAVLCLLVLSSAAWADSIVFDAASPKSDGISAVGASVSGQAADGTPVVSLPKNTSDYYKRNGLHFRVPETFAANAEEVFLLIEHQDTFLGLTSVRYDSREAGPAAPADPVAGYTCTGTGHPRRSLFRLARPEFRHRGEDGCDIRIEGIGAVRRLVLKTALDPGEEDAVRAEIPVGPPARVKLARPMQLVISVGADADETSGLPDALQSMRELCPLAATLGFTGVESYAKWNFIEAEKGRLDWSYYDGVVNEAQRHGLKWFPLLIVGSAYSLPQWYHDSPSNAGFTCLEHGKSNNIQSIFCENQTPYVQAFLKAFGAHYEPTGQLLGIRLGPSGNYGESQYPAGGNWGYKNLKEHIHIGWWAGDPYADAHFGAWLKARYGSIDALNAAWGSQYTQWGEVHCFVPQFAETQRQRKDFVDWYMGAMTDWCERWALFAREGLPNTPVYQSAGGWGFVEGGTDYTDQAKSMVKVKGGIRVTNETDSYAQNFQVTRMASSAARFYGVDFGSEPAGFNSAKGVAARIYNVLINDGDHLFFYNGNLMGSDQAIPAWLKLAPLLDRRDEPVIDVAALYPDTLSKLDDGVFRNLYASSFYQRVATLRPRLDFDFCSERMIQDGALSRYKVLVFLWSNIVEADVLNAIDAWVRDGGTVMAMQWDRMPLLTVESDTAVYKRWKAGDTGKGKALLITEDREPPKRYTDKVYEALLAMPDLDPMTQAVLRTEKPEEVYVSALKNGTYAVLNYSDAEARVKVPEKAEVTLAPYSIAIVE